MRKRLMGMLLAAAMVISSLMPAIPVMAAEDTIPLTFSQWMRQKQDPDEVKYYTFELPSSGRVRALVESTERCDQPELYSLKGGDNHIKYVSSKYGYANQYDEFIDLVKGEYRLKVKTRDSSTVSVRVDFKSAEESFPETEDKENQDNTQSRANPIELNKTYKGQIAINDDVDYYAFEAPQNTSYKLDFSFTMEEVYLRIYDSWNNHYLNEYAYDYNKLSNTVSNYSKELTLSEGEYYLAIHRRKEENGNYSFSIISDAKPVKKQIGDVTADDLDYTGKVLAPELIVTDTNGAELTQGTDYTVKFNPSTVKNAGTYRATVTGIGKYEGTKTVSFKVVAPKTLSKVSAVDLDYTGKTLRGKVTVKGSDGKTLTVGKDYSISYAPKSVKAVGTYKATVKGIDDYTGTKTISFKVNPKATTLNSVKPASKAITVSFKPQTKEMDGYVIQYSTDKTFKTSFKKVTVSKSKTSHKLTKLSGNKKYYVRIATYKKVAGKVYTSKWSETKSTTTKR